MDQCPGGTGFVAIWDRVRRGDFLAGDEAWGVLVGPGCACRRVFEDCVFRRGDGRLRWGAGWYDPGTGWAEWAVA